MYQKILIFIVFIWILLDSVSAQTFTQKTLNFSSKFSEISKTEWGDYDNDNLLDVIVTGVMSGSSETYLYRNNGNNTFTAVTGVPSTDAVFVDYNKDNFLDIVYYSTTSSSYCVLINNHDGTFTTKTLASSSAPSYFCVKDFNGDGNLDIAYYKSSIYILLNNGDGTFTSRSISAHSANSVFLCADFDNNGAIDFIVRRSAGSVLLKNNGKAVFTEQQLSSTDNDLLGIGNMYNKGKIDFVTEPKELTAGSLAIYNNNSSFARTVVASLGSGISQAYAGDVNNDNISDLVVQYSGSTGNALYTQSSSNAFSKKADLSFSLGVVTDQGINGYVENCMPFGDCDNDGDLDILMGNNLYINNLNTKVVPDAPTNLRYTISGTTLTLMWDGVSSQDVTYNLYLKTADGTQWISSQSDTATGFRRVVQLGNVGTSTQLIVNGLPAGTFDWGVQSINNAYVGSVFAKSTFVTITIAPEAEQKIQTNLNGNTLTATEYPYADSQQWYYGTSESDISTPISGVTGLTYTPNFSKAGTYYVTCVCKKGSQTFTSNVVKIVVFDPEIKLEYITTSPFLLTPSLNTYATIGFSIIGTYTSSNIFTIYLSDANGDFTNQTVLTTATVAGILTTNFADDIPSGKNYKIKIVSNSPYVVSNISDPFEIIRNHAPTDIILTTNIDEHSPAGSVVSTVDVVDVDASDTHTWTLLSGNTYFTLENGVLKTNQYFDFETQISTYTISIKVVDYYGETLIQTFNIVINNINEAPVLTVPTQYYEAMEIADISVTGFNITDVDVFDKNVQVTLTSTDGVSSISSLKDSEIVGGQQGTGLLIFETTLSRATTILNDLIYKSNRYFCGTAVLTVNVSDLGNTGKGGAKTDTKILTFTIDALPPEIWVQPVSLIKGCMGDRISFSIVAKGAGTLIYQWYHNGIILYSERSSVLYIDIDDLEQSGEYYCTVKNPNPLMITSTIGTLLLSPQTMDAAVANVKLCSGDPVGAISITATGGWGDYTYSVDGVNFYTTNIFEKLTAGTYAVTIKDLNNCITSRDFVVTAPPLLKPNVSGTDISCKDYKNGELSVNVLGGTAPFTVQVVNFNHILTFETNQDSKNYSSLAAGIYSVNIWDKNQCDTFAIVTISEPDYLTFDTQLTSPVCYGESNGNIDFTLKGGTPPYNFYWTNQVMTDLIHKFDAGSYSLSQVAKVGGLPAGNYEFYITDTRSCSTAKKFVLVQPSLLTATYEVTQSLTSLVASGGTPSYQYSDNGRSFYNDNRFSNLSSGYRKFVVRDANFCTASVEEYVATSQAIVPTADFKFVSDKRYATFTNCSLNGTSYSWDFGDGSYSQEENPTHTYANIGNYTVRLTVYNGAGYAQKEKLLTIADNGNSTGIESVVESTFNVYPNPTQDQFTVSFSDLTQSPKLTLFDSSGRKIWETDLKQTSTLFSVSNLAKGIYTLQLKTNTSIKTQKLIVY